MFVNLYKYNLMNMLMSLSNLYNQIAFCGNFQSTELLMKYLWDFLIEEIVEKMWSLN